ncbi:hypothetical protein ABCW43_23060 [Neorhizobium sp. IRAMC:178]|uniref:hypothetical protein n=1 Tax=Neorhizobium tunisiense TaxID=3144793 RepID=UPI0031F61DD4
MLDRAPIVIADAGPLIRLAAAGLLDAMRLTNRKIVIVYEDGAVPNLIAAATVPMTLVTTRAFVREIEERGYNLDAVQALEAVPYNLKPAIRTVIDANSGPSESFPR